MKTIVNLLLTTFAVIFAAYLLPGVHVNGYLTALLVAIVFSVINALIKPIIFILTLPINIFTLGLFSFLVNGLLVILVTYIVKGFSVDNLLWAIIFSILLSIINSILKLFL